MTSDDVLRKVGSCMSVGRRMTSGFNSHLSCTPKWSKGFETNIDGQQIFSERLFLGAIFTNGTNALAGKGLTQYTLFKPISAFDEQTNMINVQKEERNGINFET